MIDLNAQRGDMSSARARAREIQRVTFRVKSYLKKIIAREGYVAVEYHPMSVCKDWKCTIAVAERALENAGFQDVGNTWRAPDARRAFEVR